MRTQFTFCSSVLIDLSQTENLLPAHAVELALFFCVLKSVASNSGKECEA